MLMQTLLRLLEHLRSHGAGDGPISTICGGCVRQMMRQKIGFVSKFVWAGIVDKRRAHCSIANRFFFVFLFVSKTFDFLSPLAPETS